MLGLYWGYIRVILGLYWGSRPYQRSLKWGFPKIRGTFLDGPVTKIIVFEVSIGVPYSGKLPYTVIRVCMGKHYMIRRISKESSRWVDLEWVAFRGSSIDLI